MPSTREPGPSLLEKLRPALPVETILRTPAEGSIVVEPYRPLGSCLDWQLGQLFYRRRGNSAFLNGEVPYMVNNDGMLAARAASLLFTSLEERAASGSIEPDIRVLELGGGSCLFARGFLLAFERISRDHGRDYPERLTYVLADHSEPMLRDAERYGVFPPGSRVLLARTDAVEQRFHWLGEGLDEPLRVDAVFLNYLLDCLPATVLRRNTAGLEQMWVQTELPAPATPGQPVDDRRERVLAFARDATKDPGELIELYPLFRLRCRFQAALESDVPELGTIAPLLKEGVAVLHSYSAAACLDACLQRLREGGFVLLSDYRAAARGERETEDIRPLVHQHFGSSTAIGLNFEQLERVAAGIPGGVWGQPETDDESLVVRLAGRGSGPRVIEHFREALGGPALARLREPREAARRHRDAGADQLALESYREAVRLQPENWHALSEVARFCEATLHRHEMAMDLARAGLELNPIDPDLWNTLGDGLFSLGRREEAEQAFRWALQLSPASVRARYNLVYTLTRSGDLPGALGMISEALAADGAGEYADRLLRRQKEILNAMKQRRQQTEKQMADRYIWDSGGRTTRP